MAASASLAFRILATENSRAAFKVTADGATDVDKKLGLLGRTASKTGQVFMGALKTGLAAGFAAVSVAVIKGIKDAADYNTLAAKTAAVLKSTGNAAGTTVKHVQDLAGQLESLSGVDETLIINGENVLATFTNIRNEAGKGNDVFDQATKAALNLSVALGTDMQGASVLVGKALNDPIKGITALTRAGVTFTDAQKAQIRALVESGDRMGAQKIILKELSTEFGGAAEAAGQGFTGALARAEDAVGDFFRGVGQLALPALSGFADTIGSKVVPGMSDFVRGVQAGSDAAVENGNTLTHLGVLAQDTFDALVHAAKLVGPPLVDIGHALQQALLPLLKDVTAVALPLAALLGGTLLVGLHALADVLGFIGDHGQVFALLATGVLAYVAAAKTAAAVTSAAKSVYDTIISAYETMAIKAMYAADGNLKMATGMTTAKAASAAFGGVVAIAAIGLGLWAKKNADAKQAVAEHKGRVDSLTDALKQNKGAVDDNVRGIIIQQAEQRGLLKQAGDLGIGMDTYSRALFGNHDAQKAVSEAAKAAYDHGQISLEQLNRFVSGTGEQASVLGDSEDAFKRQASALDAATEGTKGASDAAKDHAKKLQEEKEKADKLYDSLMKLAGGNLDVIDAQAKFADALREVDQSLAGLNGTQRANTRSLSINTEEGSKARQALTDHIRTIFATADALRAQGKSVDQVRANTSREIDVLRQHYTALGYNKQQVDAIIRSLGDLGRQKPRPKVSVDTSQATGAINALNRMLTTLDGRKVSTYAYNFQQTIVKSAGGGRVGYSMGGDVTGGIPGVDSVPLLAMPGERVLTVAQNQAYKRGMLPGQNGGASGGGVYIGQVYVTLKGATGREAALEFAAELRNMSRRGFQVPSK